ncbi:MAG: flap endonuclease [Defluviitaleaceae bacterium]|nr:flap endonuclease [Defluviitaleaceae bacterium]
MKNLLIVDGHNLLFQMFYGMPSRITNKEGKAIHGVMGFVGALIKIIKMTDAAHIIVVFDGEQENERVNLSPDYKANRVDYSAIPDDENPFSQLCDIYAALDFMKIRYVEATDFEADDVIASYVHRYSGEVQVFISSFDSDFFQLISDAVFVLRYRGKNTVTCDAAYVQSKYGVLPEQYADFKSLTGDSADNIKGAEKVGPKTAAALINQFGSLQGVLDNIDRIEKPSVMQSVLRNKERLQMNYSLIKLDYRQVPIFDLIELDCAYSGIATHGVLRGIGVLG